MGWAVCGAACVRACAGLGESTCQLGWPCPGAWSLSRAPRKVTGFGWGGVGWEERCSIGALGKGGGETTNLLSALLIMLVRVKLASGSKKGAQGGERGKGTFVRWH